MESSMRIASIRGSMRSMSRSASSWRTTSTVFGRSGREEDDEEALKWAVLEKLPTYDRMRRGILKGAGGPAQEVDIQDLGILERKNLLEKLVKTLICRMTLLLGPPSSGKTTLLLALSGKLDSTLKVSGEVTYNGHHMNEFVPQRTSAYISQHDTHIGEMTVRETMAFSSRCQGVGTRYDMLTELSRREKEANIKPDPEIDVYMKAISVDGQENVVTDYILKILGLEICADTMVGDSMIRGISGGQKKRVTTGEMLVGPSKALFMDEISTGLDSSTTYQIVNSLRQSVHILGGTAVIALLQPAPETYELFDDIILLSEGKIVYQGPREHVLEFFELMGFKCPERKGVADFCYVSVNEFAEAFRSFHVGLKLGVELGTPFDRSRNHPAALTTSKYGISKMELLKVCTSREWLLMKRNSFVYIFKVVQLIILGLIAMTVFLRTKMHRRDAEDGVIFLGAMFLGLVTHLFNGFAELAMSIAKLPIFYKQRDLLFYPSWAYALPTWILKIPISFLECAVWICMTYYVIGFDPNINRFFKHYVLLVLISQMASGLFRLLAALGREMVVADTFGSFAQIVLLILGGFLISREKIKKWWIWGYWSSPLMYAQNAIAVNEFLGHSWNKYVPGYNDPLGVEILKIRGIFVDANWYWIGVGALIGYIFLFNALFIFFLDWLDPFGKGQTTISEETLTEKQTNRTGASLEILPSRAELLPTRADSFKGAGVNGLSTEQRKRLTIAVELVANPSIIFMDEPTSGLDARAAAIVMRTVRNTVDTGRTVVCTIHQPSIDIFEAFDELFLMKRGGEEIYVGPLGHSSCHLIEYFEDVEGVRSIKDGYNPATWMLEVTTQAQEDILGVNFAEIYRNSELYRRNKALINELSAPPAGSKDLFFPTKYSQSFLTQCNACLWKQHKSYWRNPSYTATRIFFTAVIAIIFGTIFWKLGTKVGTQQDLFNSLGSMYAAVLFIGIQNGQTVQPIVDVERTVFYREKAAGMYSALPYAFAQVLIEIPHIFLQTIIYGLIVYSCISFHWTLVKFFWYMFFMFMTFMYFTFYGMMAVAMTPNSDIAAIVSTAFYAIWNIFAGFLIPRPRIPLWWRWYSWACPVAWTLYGLVASQFGDYTTTIETGETVQEFLRRYFGFRHDFLGAVAAAITCFAVLFAFVFAFSIKAFNFQRR